MCERVREREHTHSCKKASGVLSCELLPRPAAACAVRERHVWECVRACVCTRACVFAPRVPACARDGPVIPPGDTGAGPRGAITGPGTCPGKRPDVSGIKTTHTPCQTVGRMDGCRKNMGVIKKKKGRKRE